jgi:hypothetical protein
LIPFLPIPPEHCCTSFAFSLNFFPNLKTDHSLKLFFII